MDKEKTLTQIKEDQSVMNKRELILEYDKNLDKVRELTREFIKQDNENEKNRLEKDGTIIKDKKYLRDRITTYTEHIKRVLLKEGIKFRKKNTVYYEINEISQLIAHEFVGYSVLRLAMEDPKVSDVFCIKWNKIFVEREGKKIRYPLIFRSEKHYSDFIERLLREDKKEINNANKKIVDFDLYGDRYAVKSKAVSPNGETLTIRKHKEDQITLEDLINGNTMSKKLAECLGLILKGECNMIIAGITGSGKTTTLRALLNHYVNDKRIGVAEDTRELFLKNEHTVEYVSTSEKNSDNYPVTLGDLVRTFLREKPDMIVIGEVRGIEMDPAVEAMATGHSTLFSMHSGTPFDTINRGILKYLESKPTIGTEIAERIIGNALDFILIQDDIPEIGRRVTSLTQVSYDFNAKQCKLETICEYNFETDDFDFVSGFDKARISKMRRRGLKYEQLKPYIVGQ